MTRIEHLLVCLAEECAEVAQTATKALRFGLDDTDPERNIRADARIGQELNDLLAVVEMLRESGVNLGRFGDPASEIAKKAKVEHFLEFSRSRGKLG
jgi:hypothetical protein